VAEAHAVGLVHRDLKPANLFLIRKRDGAPVIKVLDFGLSKANPGKGRHALTQTTSNFGTPQYMSPEQIQSAKHVDARTDQHALAMVLYELLTGSPPFDAESITALAVVIATQPAPVAHELRPDVPPALSAALVRGMAKRPEDRFPDLGAFAAAIAPFGPASARLSASSIAAVLAPGSRSQSLTRDQVEAANALDDSSPTPIPQPRGDSRRGHAPGASVDHAQRGAGSSNNGAGAPSGGTPHAEYVGAGQTPGHLGAPENPGFPGASPHTGSGPVRPRLAPAMAAQTHAPLTRSRFDLSGNPRNRAVVLVVASAATVILVGLVAGALVLLKRPPEKEITSASAGDVTAAAVSPVVPAEAPPAVEPSVAPALGGAEVPVTTPSALAETLAKPPRTGDPGASEIFGGKRK
jgi:eukaryotic-like serine/threonine-protein kinase